MTKRLQVLLDDAEMAEFQERAKAQHQTLAEWVRQALRRERSRYPNVGTQKKIQVVREAYGKHGPTGDIDQMNREIESGYLQESN